MFASENLIAESFGAIAVIFNFIGYRQQDINRYRLISAIALASISIHFFLLGALAAGYGCALACIRNIVAMRFRGKSILILFILANLGFFIYEWFYLQSAWIILFAYTSSMIFTVGSIVLTSALRIRQWFILAEVLGLLYAVLVGSIFGTIFNTINLSSIFYTLYKENRKTNKVC
ncbi:YgjV family protein [Glaciecola petra]|uniref:YgjV family protein n=1 Tax=Glaciecola petra TaxID=3075602 RepID=A0ABU2ZYN0_9ALTE|nr:YgjV family protein [Aestuariibacter sp. P117]MDT0596542.1 YgjV family protein [Aestuariibacter sp. P117]